MTSDTEEIIARLRRSMERANSADAALHAGVHGICEACDIPYGEIWRPYPESTVLCLRGAWHQPEFDFSAFEAESRKFAFASGVGVPGRVWQTRALAAIPDLRTTRTFTRQKAALAAGFRSVVGVPVVHGEEMAAALVFMMFNLYSELPGPLVNLAAALGPALSRHLGGGTTHGARPSSSSGVRVGAVQSSLP